MQTPCQDPDVGLDSRTLGSQPEPKADTQPLRHSAIPDNQFFKVILYCCCIYSIEVRGSATDLKDSKPTTHNTHTHTKQNLARRSIYNNIYIEGYIYIYSISFNEKSEAQIFV